MSIQQSINLQVEDDVFSKRHMPDLGHEVEDFKTFTWSLKNWQDLPVKVTSPHFECGGHKW